MTKFRVLELHFPVLELHFPVLERPFLFLERPFPVLECPFLLCPVCPAGQDGTDCQNLVPSRPTSRLGS